MRSGRLARAAPFAALAAVLSALGCGRAPTPDPSAGPAGATLEADTRALCALGPRVTGSPACGQAEEWAAARFREGGLDVRLESWAWAERPPGSGVPRNVVADLRGRGRAEEIVLLAAHLDTVAAGPGANDDAVNAALVLGVARAMREAGPADRSVRFVLFTGEEEKLLGSRAYVAAHAAELSKQVIAVVFDLGSAPVRGFFMNGRKDELRALFQRSLSARGSARDLLGLYTIWEGADSFSFVEAGVPALAAYQDLEPYRAVYHSERDTVETVDFSASRANASLAAALARGAADDREPPLRRMTPGETVRLLAPRGIGPGRPSDGVP